VCIYLIEVFYKVIGRTRSYIGGLKKGCEYFYKPLYVYSSYRPGSLMVVHSMLAKPRTTLFSKWVSAVEIYWNYSSQLGHSQVTIGTTVDLAFHIKILEQKIGDLKPGQCKPPATLESTWEKHIKGRKYIQGKKTAHWSIFTNYYRLRLPTGCQCRLANPPTENMFIMEKENLHDKSRINWVNRDEENTQTWNDQKSIPQISFHILQFKYDSLSQDYTNAVEKEKESLMQCMF